MIMKETPLSNCEKAFISQAIKENQRLDGRKNDEFRPIKINFGRDWGSANVSLGETKVLAQVSCELGQPKATRPCEGMMHINVELGPMAAAHFEAGRNSDLNVQISRTLERAFKDSRCVDLESLCVKAEERVWVLRLDLNILNHEGNLIDCCSIAALCALMHFKRPDVSINEGEIKVHTASEKELIPIIVHHYPVCISYCTFNDGEIAVADPTAIEERTAESSMVFGINSYREICCLNLSGSTLTSSELVLRCANRAANQAKIVVDYIKSIFQADAAARERDEEVGFTECLRMNKITALAEDRLALKLRHFSFADIKEQKDLPMAVDSEECESTKVKAEAISLDKDTVILNSTQSSIQWIPDDDDDDDENGDNEYSANLLDDFSQTVCSDNEVLEQEVETALKYSNKRLNQPISKMKKQPHPLSTKNYKNPNESDSEEEQQMTIQ